VHHATLILTCTSLFNLEKKMIEQIFRSAWEGDTSRALYLLEKNPELLTEVGSLHLGDKGLPVGTVLHFACWANNENLAYELVKRGADPREIPLHESSNGALYASLLACHDTYGRCKK
jgi:hypothetical protein